MSFRSPLFMVLFVPGVLAFVFGWLAFRSRVTGVYLSIITQALTYALLLAFFRNDMGFGGNNGLTDFKDILGFNVQAQGTRVALFMLTVADAGRHVHALPAAGDVDLRQGSRVHPRRRKPHALPRLPRRELQDLRVHVSACLAGLAGALYVPQVGIINPSEFAPANSIEAVIWVAVGGRGTLTGAARRRRGRQLPQDVVHHAAFSHPTGCSRSAACSFSSRWRCRKASSARIGDWLERRREPRMRSRDGYGTRRAGKAKS